MNHTVQIPTKPPPRKIVTYSHKIVLNITQQCSTDATFAQASDKTITQNKNTEVHYNVYISKEIIVYCYCTSNYENSNIIHIHTDMFNVYIELCLMFDMCR